MNTYVVSYIQINTNCQDQQIVEADSSLVAMRKFLEDFKSVVYTNEDFNKFTVDKDLIENVYTSLDASISVIDVTNN